MATSAERKALNEAAFRDANDKLERGAEELVGAEDDSLVPFLCECPQTACRQIVLLTLREYGELRARRHFGLAALGHEDLAIERVVAQNDRFVTTEKFGPAAATHAATDPRR